MMIDVIDIDIFKENLKKEFYNLGYAYDKESGLMPFFGLRIVVNHGGIRVLRESVIMGSFRAGTDYRDVVKFVVFIIDGLNGFNSQDSIANKHSHYKRDVSKLDYIDVYRIIDLYKLHDPCFQHALKKILVPGERGHKDIKKDIQDIIDTMQRKLEMMREDGV